MTFRNSPRLAFAFTLALLAPAPADAAPARKAVTFEFEWMFHGDRVDLERRRVVHTRMRAALTLHPDGAVSGGRVRDNAQSLASDVVTRSGRLGGGWRVIDASTLQSRREFPNSFQTILLRTSGETCSVTVEYALKPGLSVHLYPQVGALNRMVPFENVSVSHAECAVRPQ